MPIRIALLETIPDPGTALLRAHGLVIEPRISAGVSGILCSLNDRIDETALRTAGSGLRIVANYGAGHNNIDVAAASRLGVLVTNTPGVLTDATADLAFALILAVARRVAEGDRLVRSGEWSGWAPLQLLGAEVAGSVLGIVGAGRIGSAVARRAHGFAMRILYVARRTSPELDGLGATRVSLEECLERADFVSLHVPLTGETRHLIGARELSRMKPTAYLINTARGQVLDEAALVEALRAGRIAGAGLDVYEDEPRIQAGLAELDQVVLLPHLGSATRSTRERMAVMAAENLIAGIEGRTPPNLVTAVTGESRKGA